MLKLKSLIIPTLLLAISATTAEASFQVPNQSKTVEEITRVFEVQDRQGKIIHLAGKKSPTQKVCTDKSKSTDACMGKLLKKKHKPKTPPASSKRKTINSCSGIVPRKCPDGTTVDCTQKCKKTKKLQYAQ